MGLWRRINLVYLLFAFAPLVFDPRFDVSAWWWTFAAVVVFLPIYWQSYVSGERVALVLALLMAVIGFALTLKSYGGNTFLIYAMATLGHSQPARRAIIAGAGLLAVYGLQLFWLDMYFAFWMIVALLGSGLLIGGIFARRELRKNMELRLTQDEVRRLERMTERERIGRDLHDLLGHTLSLIALKSELAGKMIDRDLVAARQQVGEIEEIARSSLTQVREAVSGIRALQLQSELANARLNLLSAGVSLDVKTSAITELSGKQETMLAIVVREAVTNIIRHARASRVDIELRQSADRLMLSISDNGQGAALVFGNGLTGMRERIAEVGGELDIQSSPGAGCHIYIKLPAAHGGR